MEVNVYEIALIPIISGLVEMFKQLGLSKKYCSLVSLMIGLIFGLLFVQPFNIRTGMLVGIVLGLSASGLYSGTKSIQYTVKANNEKEDNKSK